jgi:hypothetical protein
LLVIVERIKAFLTDFKSVLDSVLHTWKMKERYSSVNETKIARDL